MIVYYLGRKYVRADIPMAVSNASGYRRSVIPDDALVRHAEQALKRPPDFGYYGEYPLFESWGYAGIGQHRDSDALDRSNYRSIMRDAARVCPDEDMQWSTLEWIADFRAGHWAVGWVESIIARVLYDADEDITPDNITSAFRWITEIAVSLRDDYPVYDEMDYSELECEERDEAFDQAWDSMVRGWDEEDSGPLPTDEEKDYTRDQLSGSESETYSDEDQLREIMDGKRLEDTLAQYPDTPRVSTVIPGQMAFFPHPLEGS